MMQNPPQPYRFKSSSLRFQIPNPITLLPDTRFWRTMRESTAYKFLRDASFVIRTWARRTIWGDRVSRSSQRACAFANCFTAVPSFPRTSQHSRPISRSFAERRTHDTRRQRDRGQPSWLSAKSALNTVSSGSWNINTTSDSSTGAFKGQLRDCVSRRLGQIRQRTLSECRALLQLHDTSAQTSRYLCTLSNVLF